jgi:hypothetical protein
MSQDKFIEVASACRPHVEEEIRGFEVSHDLRFPERYRAFLAYPGPCRVLFANRREIEFHRLEDVARYEDLFDDLSVMYRKFLPIGADEELQEVYAISLEEPTRGQVSRFSHETVPEDWAEDAVWQPLDELLTLIAESGGRIPI